MLRLTRGSASLMTGVRKFGRRIASKKWDCADRFARVLDGLVIVVFLVTRFDRFEIQIDRLWEPLLQTKQGPNLSTGDAALNKLR
jgi:hypothetical protein